MASYSSVQSTALSLGNLIVVSPQAYTGIQPQDRGYFTTEKPILSKQFLFNYNEEETLMISSDITDHYTEDNEYLNNQISIKPIEYTLTGLIGELNDVVPPSLVPLQTAAQKLTIMSAYTPQLTATALIAFNTATQIYNNALVIKDNAVSSWDSITNSQTGPTVFSGSETEAQLANEIAVSRNQNKQQVAFQQLYGYWRNRTLFTVQTPWAVFRNMAIKTLTPVQSAESRMETAFSITFKQIRFAQTISNVQEVANNQGRAATNIQSAVNKGQAATQQVLPDTSRAAYYSLPGATANV